MKWKQSYYINKNKIINTPTQDSLNYKTQDTDNCAHIYRHVLLKSVRNSAPARADVKNKSLTTVTGE